MGFSAIIRNCISIANNVTADLQVTVQHYAWIGNGTTYGEALYASLISRQALVEMKQRWFRLPDGTEIIQKASITFLTPITANGTSGRQEPIDPRDKIVLPNGYTGPIKFISGLENNYTDSPYMLEVVLG